MSSFREQLVLNAVRGLCANQFLAEQSKKVVEALLSMEKPIEDVNVDNVYESMIAKAAVTIADNVIGEMNRDRA